MNIQPNSNALLRAKYERNYNAGRSNLLLVIVFTLISMVTFYFNGSYFLFSAFVPLLVFSVFSAFSFIANGTYDTTELGDPEVLAFFEEVGAGTWLAIGIAIAVAMLGVYFVCWLLSKKHCAALVIAAVFFGIDCLVILLNFDASAIVDLLFHAWVMYYLISAIVANAKLKKLPVPVFPIEGEAAPLEEIPSVDSYATDATDAMVATETTDNTDQSEQN